MASGTINLKTNDTSWKIRLKWSSSANANTNKSTITFTYQVYRDVSGSVINASQYYGYCRWSYVGGSAQDEESITGTTLSVSPRTWTTIHTWKWTVPHKADGTRTITIWGLMSADNGIETDTFQKNITMTTIPKAASITAAPNFNDEQNPTITYSNPAGNNATLLQACISFDGSKDDIPYRNISKTGTSYTFNLTDAERTTLRKATLSGSNTRTVYFYLKYTIGGNTSTTRLAKTLTITNATPTISAIVMDTNEKTVALTGDRLTTLIKGYSNASYEMSATAKKNASITGYSAVNGSTKKTTSSGVFNAITNSAFKFTITDNRGLSATKDIKLNLVDYFKPTCAFSLATTEVDPQWAEENPDTVPAAEANNYVKARVEVSGKFFNSTFGTNGVKNVLKIEVLQTGQSNWFELPDILWGDSVSGNTYKASFEVRGIYYTDAITFQFRVSDKLVSNITTDKKTLKHLPVFDWDKNDFRFNVPVNLNNHNVVGANAIYFKDAGQSLQEGVIFQRDDGSSKVDRLNLYNGSLTVRKNCDITSSEDPLIVYALSGGTNYNVLDTETVADYVIETGTEAMGSNGTWYWSKWASGKAECYGYRNYGNMAVSTAYGSLYKSEDFQQTYPTGLFSAAPTTNISFYSGENYGGWVACNGGGASKDGTAKFIVCRPASATLQGVRIAFQCMGRWK